MAFSPNCGMSSHDTLTLVCHQARLYRKLQSICDSVVALNTETNPVRLIIYLLNEGALGWGVRINQAFLLHQGVRFSRSGFLFKIEDMFSETVD